MTIGEKIDEIRLNIAKIMPMVESHNETLYGNGKAGLKTEVALIAEKQRTCVARTAEQKVDDKWNVGTALRTAGVIIAVVMAFYSMTR